MTSSAPALRPHALLLPDRPLYGQVYGPAERAEIAARTQLAAVALTGATWQEYPDVCAQTEIIFSSWGMPVMNASFLASFPRLKAVFYAAGSVKEFVTPESWERDIVVCSAAVANAIPVAEFTVAQIVLSAKGVFRAQRQVRSDRDFSLRERTPPRGLYGLTVGLISLGTIGRLVVERLRPYPVRILAYDPCVDDTEAEALGVTRTSLETLFSQADVVSCHAPLIPVTRHLLRTAHFAAMKRDATFINTARGAVVDEAGLIHVLQERPDLSALLDVADPEPPAATSPLYTLPNVFLTPHIAGSVGTECRRLGAAMVDEFIRYQSGLPLETRVDRERLSIAS